MPNIVHLANEAARLRRIDHLAVPGAVWRVLRAKQLAERPDAREIAGDVCAELQKRSVARRKKNKRLGIRSPRIPEQFDLGIEWAKAHEADAEQVVDQRGGDPNDE